MYSMKTKRTTLIAFGLAIGLAGCATASAGGNGGSRSSPNRIVAEELAGLQQYDAYQAIQRLRPRWLQSRGGSDPEVYVDGARRGGGLGELRGIRTAAIAEMEFMSASDASIRFGTGHTGGAILVTTKR